MHKLHLKKHDLTSRDLIVAIEIENIDFTECVAKYQACGVTVYERVVSSIYSKRILEALNLCGAIRVSPLHCHGVEDIDRFLRITAEIVASVRFDANHQIDRTAQTI